MPHHVILFSEPSTTDETTTKFLDDGLSQGVEVSMNKKTARMKCRSRWPISFCGSERCIRRAGIFI
jgi:hypothetical protein